MGKWPFIGHSEGYCEQCGEWQFCGVSETDMGEIFLCFQCFFEFHEDETEELDFS